MVRQLFLILLVAAFFPSPKSGYVHDFADLIKVEDEAELEALGRAVDTETTAKIAVVTIQSLGNKPIDEYANGLFNTWGIGRKNVNNGVLFLVSAGDRRVKIEVGYGLEPLLPDGLCGEILDDYVLPRFKEGKYVDGIKEGTSAIAALLRANPQAAAGIAESGPRFVRSPYYRIEFAIRVAAIMTGVVLLMGFIASCLHCYPGFLFGLIVPTLIGAATATPYFVYGTPLVKRFMPPLVGIIVGVILVLIYNVYKFKRYRTRRCPNCSKVLDLLDETQDDAALSESEAMEEKVKSVDYDVWQCSACAHRTIQAYPSLFSRYKKCDKCLNRTLKETRNVVKHATTISEGIAEITRLCCACGNSTLRHESIPRISESSRDSGGEGGFSGGGGSCGGGSSGGGGASRGW